MQAAGRGLRDIGQMSGNAASAAALAPWRCSGLPTLLMLSGSARAAACTRTDRLPALAAATGRAATRGLAIAAAATIVAM